MVVTRVRYRNGVTGSYAHASFLGYSRDGQYVYLTNNMHAEVCVAFAVPLAKVMFL